jgi:hypothetical protein
MEHERESLMELQPAGSSSPASDDYDDEPSSGDEVILEVLPRSDLKQQVHI